MLQHLLIKVLKDASTLLSGRRQRVGAELWGGGITEGTLCLTRRVVATLVPPSRVICVLLLERGIFPMERDGWMIKPSAQVWLQSDRWELAKSKELFSILKIIILSV